MRDQRTGLSRREFQFSHILCVVQETSRTPDPFSHTASESVTSRDDFEEQIAGVEVSVFGLSHRGVGTVWRSGWDHELQYVRVDVFVNGRWKG